VQSKSIWANAMKFGDLPTAPPRPEVAAYPYPGQTDPVTDFDEAAYQPVQAVPGLQQPTMVQGRAVSFEQVQQHPLLALISKLIPPGYGTYVMLFIWIVINVLSVGFGITLPTFEAVQGNEGVLTMGALVIGYLRRAMGR